MEVDTASKPPITYPNYAPQFTAFVQTPQESSWDPPPEWHETPGDWQGEHQSGEPIVAGSLLGLGDAVGGGSGGGGEDNETGEGEGSESIIHVNAFSSQASSSAPASSSSGVTSGPRSVSGAGGRLEVGDHSTASEGNVATRTRTAASTGGEPLIEQNSQSIVVGDGVSGGRLVGQSGGGSGSGSGSGTSLDQTSSDELSQWSLERLREVSKVIERLPSRSGVSRVLVLFCFVLFSSATEHNTTQHTTRY